MVFSEEGSTCEKTQGGKQPSMQRNGRLSRKGVLWKQKLMKVRSKRETGLGHESFRCHTQETQLILVYGTIGSFKQG